MHCGPRRLRLTRTTCWAAVFFAALAFAGDARAQVSVPGSTATQALNDPTACWIIETSAYGSWTHSVNAVAHRGFDAALDPYAGGSYSNGVIHAPLGKKPGTRLLRVPCDQADTGSLFGQGPIRIYFGPSAGAGFGTANFKFDDGQTGPFSTSGGMLGVGLQALTLIPFDDDWEFDDWDCDYYSDDYYDDDCWFRRSEFMRSLRMPGVAEAWHAPRQAEPPHWAGLIGLETELGFGNIGGHTTNNCAAFCTTSNETFGDVLGKFGLASTELHSLSPFIVAGLAYGQIHSEIGGSETRDWHVGYAAGLGFDYRLSKGSFLELKYLHSDLGNVPCGPTVCGPNTTVHFTDNRIEASLNFQIGRIGWK
jgi:Outer membrane protein beta-barrel domain